MRGSDTSTSRVHATGSSGIEVVGGPSPRRPPADLRDVPHTQEPLDVRLPGRPLSARESISLGFGPQRRGDRSRGPGWYGQHPASPSGGGNHGQQGQGWFEELEDRGEQVAEGEAGGEEGQGRRLGFLIVGKLDQEVAAGSGGRRNSRGPGEADASPLVSVPERAGSGLACGKNPIGRRPAAAPIRSSLWPSAR